MPKVMPPKVIALVGNPNAGKTAVFNELTGLHQHVGNWPGVTVERKEGELRAKGQKMVVVDLPGMYSLNASSEDARIAKDYVVNEKPDVIINVVDATNLARNLYLTTQLLEMGANIVVALNMMDELETKGLKVDVAALEGLLGVPVVATSARTRQGLSELVERAMAAVGRVRPMPLKLDYGEQVEKRLKSLGMPRWLAINAIESEEAGGGELVATIAQTRYRFIDEVVRRALVQARGGDPLSVTDRIDRVVADSVWGIPIFLVLVWMVFQFTFKVGAPLVGLAERIVDLSGEYVSALLTASSAPEFLVSLVVRGLIPGVGSVIAFAPNIFLLFLAISLLEDSGYMARAAHMADRFMSRIGLHGKAFLPMVLGFGCNVPGIMATRTLESRRDRIITILLVPLISCTARLPIYVLFTGVFFKDAQGLVILSLYALGIGLALVMGKVFSRFLFDEVPSYFIMELPPYRLPSIRSVFMHAWERGSAFIHKAGTAIAGATVLVWLLSSLPWGVPYASEGSVLGKVGHLLAPALRPAGFGMWEAAAALIFGSLAKELVVGTLGIIYGAEGLGLSQVIAEKWTPASAYSFMVMALLYVPCTAVVAAIKEETGSWKWAAFAVLYTVLLGWFMAVVVFHGAIVLGGLGLHG